MTQAATSSAARMPTATPVPSPTTPSTVWWRRPMPWAVSPTPTTTRSATSCRSPTRCARHRNGRSEEHTSELQSPCNLVCRLLLEKKKKKQNKPVRLKYLAQQEHTNSLSTLHIVTHRN